MMDDETIQQILDIMYEAHDKLEAIYDEYVDRFLNDELTSDEDAVMEKMVDCIDSLIDTTTDIEIAMGILEM